MAATAVLDKHGRIIIPVELRKRMGWEAGQRLTLVSGSHALKVLSRKQAIERIQEEVRKHARPGVSVVDELIRERRAETLRDEKEYREWAVKRGRLAEKSRG
jgi:bifunctional DNA-binding transcriptional regulator/antitoxin component of YhaV-PrlF toxin-antitoxin module